MRIKEKKKKKSGKRFPFFHPRSLGARQIASGGWVLPCPHLRAINKQRGAIEIKSHNIMPYVYIAMENYGIRCMIMY